MYSDPSGHSLESNSPSGGSYTSGDTLSPDKMDADLINYSKITSRAQQLVQSTKLTGVLQMGSSGNDVRAAQQYLIDLGYLGSNGADGIFGNITKQSVQVFQKDNHLTVDGIVGPQTLAAFQAAKVGKVASVQFAANSDKKKQCDGSAYLGDNGGGNATTGNKTTTVISNHGYPITYTNDQWATAGFILTAGAAVDTVAVAGPYIVAGAGAIKDKILDIFNSGIPNAFENVISSAKAAQAKGNYLADEFTGTILKKGTKIYGLTPGPTAWYTTEDMVNASGYNYKTLYDGLQIRPDEILGYRQFVTEYEVTEDVVVATDTLNILLTILKMFYNQ